MFWFDFLFFTSFYHGSLPAFPDGYDDQPYHSKSDIGIILLLFLRLRHYSKLAVWSAFFLSDKLNRCANTCCGWGPYAKYLSISWHLFATVSYINGSLCLLAKMGFTIWWRSYLDNISILTSNGKISFDYGPWSPYGSIVKTPEAKPRLPSPCLVRHVLAGASLMIVKMRPQKHTENVQKAQDAPGGKFLPLAPCRHGGTGSSSSGSPFMRATFSQRYTQYDVA